MYETDSKKYSPFKGFIYSKEIIFLYKKKRMTRSLNAVAEDVLKLFVFKSTHR